MRISAINGTITVKLPEAPATTPTAADFTVSQTIDGGTATSVAPTVTYDAATKTVTLRVTAINATTQAQTVSYTVDYKGETYKPGFVVSATTEAATAIAAAGLAPTPGTQTVTVIYSAPVNATTGTNVGNYQIQTNTGTPAALVVPTKVTLNTSAVGPYAAGQIATIELPATTLTAAQAASVAVSNVTTAAGATVAAKTLDFIPELTDGAAPVLSSPSLTDGITTSTVASPALYTSFAGKELTLSITATDAASNIAGAQYRVQKTDGTFGAWTSLNAQNPPFGKSRTEVVTGKISTTGWEVGVHNVQVRAVDGLGNITANTALTTNATITIVPTSTDIIAPTVAFDTTVGSTTQAPTFTLSPVTTGFTKAAKTVRVTGTATDTSSVGTATGVQKVEYRVREFNAVTGVYSVSTNWTAALPTDGAYGGTPENFIFETPALDLGKSYVIETRATDVAGNVGVTTPVTTVVGTGITPVTVAPTGSVTPLVTGTFTVNADTTIPSVTVAAGTTTLGSVTTPSNETAVNLAGTAADTGSVVADVRFAVYKELGGGSRQLVRSESSEGVSRLTANYGTFAIDYALPSENGTYTFEVVAIDSAGNRSAVQSATHVLDVVAPTATIKPNTATITKNDFIVTFNEDVSATVATLGSFEIVNALGTVATATTANDTIVLTGVNPNEYLVTLVDPLTLAQFVNGSTLRIAPNHVTDVAGNAASASYKFTATDFE